MGGGGGANAYFQRNLKNLWLLFIFIYLFIDLFIYLFIFFFFGGGGGGGGGGCPDHLSPLWIRTSVRNK